MMEKKKVQVLVFLYDGAKYIRSIQEEYHTQKVKDCDLHLKYILTDTKDESEKILKELHADYAIVRKEDFSHSLTREKYIRESNADYCILLSQDARCRRDDVYQSLINALINNPEVKYAYLRQINTNHSIERYTRRINYPKKSFIKSKKDIPNMGINTFFASDACSILDVSYFKEIGGYHKDLPTNEDMYYAYLVITSGKSIMYVADSYVDHSHKFTLKQIKRRYYLFGKFFGMNKELDDYPSTGSGLKLAFKVLGGILLEFNLPALFMFIPNMIARYIGKKKGFQDGRKEIEGK